MRKKKRCKLCNNKMKRVSSVGGTISPIEKMYGMIRIFTDKHAIERVKHSFYKCDQCDKIYQI